MKGQEEKLTNEQRNLLLSIISNNFIFIRDVAGMTRNNLLNVNSNQDMKKILNIVFLLSDSLHNVPHAIALNNLVPAKTDISIYIKLLSDIEELDSGFKRKYRHFIEQYKRNRKELMKLFGNQLHLSEYF